MDIDVFWQEFIKKEGLHPKTEYVNALCLDEDESDKRLELALSGKKTVLCTGLEYRKWADDPPMEPGDFIIITDREGEPRCAAEIEGTVIVPFGQVTEELAMAEGEDESLEQWKARQKDAFTKEAKSMRKDFTEDYKLVFETFEVITL